MLTTGRQGGARRRANDRLERANGDDAESAPGEMMRFAASVLAVASAAAALVPSGKWDIDYQQNLCLLTRPFAMGPTKAALGFRQAPADERTEIVVSRR